MSTNPYGDGQTFQRLPVAGTLDGPIDVVVTNQAIPIVAPTAVNIQSSVPLAIIAAEPIETAAPVIVVNEEGSPVEVEIVGTVPAFSGDVSVNNFPATQPVSGTVSVSNLPVTQPVSGTVSVSNLPATQPVSAAALPLPAGAATEATLLDIKTNTTPTVGKVVNRFVVQQVASGNTIVAAASPGNKHKVVGFLLSLDANGTLTFFSAGVAITGAIDMGARLDILHPSLPLFPLVETAVNQSLSFTTATGKAGGIILYITEP
jgi:hypothetical protein